MKVQVNNKEVEMTPASTLTQLAAQLELPAQGIAIAVNNKMIPRWRGKVGSVYNLSPTRPIGILISNRHSWHLKEDVSGFSYA